MHLLQHKLKMHVGCAASRWVIREVAAVTNQYVGLAVANEAALSHFLFLVRTFCEDQCRRLYLPIANTF